jgi:Kef-type K+ transport system membrane component KefB
MEVMAQPASRMRNVSVYAFMVTGTIVGFYLVQWLGSNLRAPPPQGSERFGEGGTSIQVDVLLHVLLALVVIILSARLLGVLFRFLGQPPVIGEVLAGILLGPSLLGRVAPVLSEYVLPPTVAPFLSVIAQVGIILYMFLVGIELDPTTLGRRTHSTVMVSHASIVVPFLLGAVLALGLYPKFSSSDVPFYLFALFMGVSMSVTAFPVLARILKDRSIQKTPLGVMALTCAAVDDVTAWCLLALLVSMVQARIGGVFLTVALTGAFIAIMILLVRPLVIRLVRRQEPKGLTRGAMAVVCVGMLLSALITEGIGIHAVFGAFLLGTLIPHDSTIGRELRQKLEDIVLVLFLPAYFAFTGMRTQIGLVSGAEEWLLCGLIVLVASLGKLGGTLLAARYTGSGWREALSLGVLMNTRGLMELVVLNIGLDLKVVSPTLFTMLVVMALVTTLATSPVLQAIVARKPGLPATATSADEAQAARQP